MSDFEVIDNSGLALEAFEEACERALTRIGLQAETYAKEECPVDTGNLRDSISYRTYPRLVRIGTNVEYSPYVELGTSKMAARPFIKPAAAEHGSVYKAIVEDELKNG